MKKIAIKELVSSRIFSISSTLLVNIIVLVANLGSGIITARGLEPIGRGQLLAISMWPQLIASAFTLGMPAALVYEVRQHKFSNEAIYLSALLIILVSSSIAAILLFFLLPFLIGTESVGRIQFAQAFLILSPIVSLNILTVSLFQALQDFKSFNFLRLLTPTAVIISLILGQFVCVLTPESAAISYGVAGVSSAAIAVIMASYRFRKLIMRDLKLKAAAIRLCIFGRSHAFTDVMSTLEASLDKIILVAVLSIEDLGLYAVAYGSSRLLLSSASAVSAIEFPRAAAMKQSDAIRSLMNAALTNGLFAFVPFGIGLLFADPLLNLVYGAKFISANMLFRILLTEAYFSSFSFVLIHAFLAAGLPASNSRIQAVSTVLSAFALVGGAQIAGPVGAAAAVTCVAGTKSIVLWFVLNRHRRSFSKKVET